MTDRSGATESVHTLVVGAGPAGLAAADSLAQAGLCPLIIERDEESGGLMRSIRRGDFIVDVGRKELYSRIQKVDALWTDLLGDDYIPYAHREGILYDGHIVETSRTWRGPLRGLPPRMLWACGMDYVGGRIKYGFSKPRTYQDYWYRKRGRRLSQILSQGFEEKFKGHKWSEMVAPEEESGAGSRHDDRDKPFENERMEQAPDTHWRHPARGSGQICELLERRTRKQGGRFLFRAHVREMTSSDGVIDSVTVALASSEVRTYRPLHVISSIPVELLTRLIKNGPPCRDAAVPASVVGPAREQRSTICVYLFLDESPRFPHVWLKVTCPSMQAGRVTNYAALNGKMVPKARTCLCIEFFCFGNSPLLALQDGELREIALSECATAGLIAPEKCFDSLVLRLRGADAATSWQDWASDSRRQSMVALKAFANLYNVNRPGTDKATYAGLEATAAIVTGNRAIFDSETLLTLPVANRRLEGTVIQPS